MAQSPLMADLMAGPNAPLSKAFLWCGWACITVDWLLDPSHDLSHPLRQASLHEQLQEACFLSVAMDCSTKSRAREIPRQFADGRPAPQPLRSEQHPEGLPNLSASNAERVRIDNEACAFLLKEVQQSDQRCPNQTVNPRPISPIAQSSWIRKIHIDLIRTICISLLVIRNIGL